IPASPPKRCAKGPLPFAAAGLAAGQSRTARKNRFSACGCGCEGRQAFEAALEIQKNSPAAALPPENGVRTLCTAPFPACGKAHAAIRNLFCVFVGTCLEDEVDFDLTGVFQLGLDFFCDLLGQ